MTEEIINLDGSRNWEANILLDNVKRLEQENKELKEKIEAFKTMATAPIRMYNECEIERCKYGRALEEISGLASPHCTQCSQIITIINEVL